MSLPQDPARTHRTQVPDTRSQWRLEGFRHRWRGRSHTTVAEQALTSSLLGKVDNRRIVELGTGPGRLSPTIRASGAEYIGVDLTRAFLERSRDAVRDRPGTVFVQANILHLPFVRSSVSGACLIRVYNHLTRPVAALEEIARVMIPGGRFLTTVAVRPTLGTFEIDVRAALSRSAGESFRAVTFGRGGVVEHHRGRIVTFHPTDAELDEELRRAGVRVEEIVGAGITDLWLLRRIPLPAEALLHAGQRHPRSALFSQRWIVGSWSAPTETALPALRDCFACPRCGRPLGTVDLASDWSRECAGCSFPMRYHDSILEAVWGPVAEPDRTVAPAPRDH